MSLQTCPYLRGIRAHRACDGFPGACLRRSMLGLGLLSVIWALISGLFGNRWSGLFSHPTFVEKRKAAKQQVPPRTICRRAPNGAAAVGHVSGLRA